MRGINFGEDDSRAYFNRALLRAGVFARLERLGISDGDTVSAGKMEFDWKI
ncbi:MAG: Obg family GTPase CgtA [Oscillospiraceae bacterium]|nr:Obg family GTPase CgtA [Oscillospiraceae bacterium]